MLLSCRTGHSLAKAAALACGLGFFFSGCAQEIVSQTPSLQAPTQLAIANGEVCLPTVENIERTIPTTPLPSCDEGGQGFALVTNYRGDSLSVLASGQREPRLVNLDSRAPGVTSIPIGSAPIDVMTSSDGTAALVASQGDKSLIAVDLWTLRPFADPFPLDANPLRLDTISDDDDGTPRAALLLREPNRLDLVSAPRCTRPNTTIDRRDHLPEDTCIWTPTTLAQIELPAPPSDLSIDVDSNTAFVVYRNLGALSIIHLDDELDGRTCLNDATSAPCEVARINLDLDADPDEFSTRGAVAVDHDPLGFFVYILDRAGNQLRILDRRSESVINASLAAEPPLAPFLNTTGIPLINAPLTLAAEVERDIIQDADPALIRYRIGARVVSDTAQLYRVTAFESECLLPGTTDLLSTNEFLFDAQAREESPESACLFAPAFPLGGDPNVVTDDALLDQRLFAFDDVQVAITPFFGLRDSNNQEGRFVGRTLCNQPEAFVDALRNAGATTAQLGCGSPLSPRPIGLEVDPDLSSYLDAAPATLTTFANTILDPDTGEAAILRSVYDQRLRNERWDVIYEGALTALPSNERGLIDADNAARFLAGGADYCAVGVEVGDRLRILTSPSDADGCDVFTGDPNVRTFEILNVLPYELELGLIDADDLVQELPRRECFDRGLSYEIRPHDAWIVTGEQSGMLSPFEREAGACVLKSPEAAEILRGRVNAGDTYRGPYFQFLLRPGEVPPTEDLSYSFQVERNFGVLADPIVNTGIDTSVTLPSSVRFLPDLGAGRFLGVIDAGAEAGGLPGGRLYLQNLSFPEDPIHYVR